VTRPLERPGRAGHPIKIDLPFDEAIKAALEVEPPPPKPKRKPIIKRRRKAA
jgi:hypothetical protein